MPSDGMANGSAQISFTFFYSMHTDNVIMAYIYLFVAESFHSYNIFGVILQQQHYTLPHSRKWAVILSPLTGLDDSHVE